MTITLANGKDLLKHLGINLPDNIINRGRFQAGIRSNTTQLHDKLEDRMRIEAGMLSTLSTNDAKRGVTQL